VKAFVLAVMAGGVVSCLSTLAYPAQQWLHFFIYLAAVLLSSGMKVAMPKSDGTMSVNFPFILLGILQLSPAQAVALAVFSVIAQCRVRVIKPFTLVQIVFNVANVAIATVLAWHGYMQLIHWHVEGAPALALASTIYFLANTLLVAVVIAIDQRISPFRHWLQNYPWYLPFYLVGAILASIANFIGVYFGWMTSLLLIPMVYTVYRMYTAQMAIVRDREHQAQETEALHLRTIEGLAMAIEAKDQSTHQHLMRVRVYVSEIGKLLGLDQSMMQALLTSSFLHDIGKLAVPEHIINKPGKLTPEEFEKMKIHPVVGADILERVRFPYPVVPIVRSHHESWDGSGYPDGLKGEEIPLGARILTVVDCFDALASERPYRKALPLAEAMAHVKSRSGIQFDPTIVALLEERYMALETMAREQLSEVAPLNTDLRVERGAAPGAGFEPEHRSAEKTTHPSGVGPGEQALANPRVDSLNLIAAASHEAKAVFELSQMLGNSLSTSETSSMLAQRLGALIPFDCCAVYLKVDGFLVAQWIDGDRAKAFSMRRIPVGEGLSGWVAQNGRSIMNGNPTVEPNYRTECGCFDAASSALAIPLLDPGGNPFGVLTLYAQGHAAFSKEHLRVLQAIESKFSQSLENALRFGVAETDARIDHLTNLPNMRHLIERIAVEVSSARDTGVGFTLAMCDLNAFKAVNDRHGHLVGNQMLQSIAESFRSSCRSSDLVARMGGDEFVFLFPALDLHSAMRRLEFVQSVVKKASSSLNLEIQVSSSLGFASFPEDGQTAEELLDVADRRMYLQKQSFYQHPPLHGPSAVSMAVR